MKVRMIEMIKNEKEQKEKDLNTELENKVLEIKRKEKEIEKVREETEKTAVERSGLNTQILALTSQLESLKKNNESEMKNMKQSLLESVQKCEASEQSNGVLKSQLTEKQNEVVEVKKDVQKALSQLEKKEKELAEMKEESDKHIEALKKEVEKYRLESSGKDERVKQFEKETIEAKDELRVQVESVKMIEMKVGFQKNANDKLQKKINEYERESLKLKSEKEQLVGVLDKLKKCSVEDEEDKKVVFNGLALAIKIVLPKEVLKIDNTMLYEECKMKNIPLKDWNCWLVERLSKEVL
ncbi:hypothetical protein EIN_164360 [Entamoeba invadens IP1]|uniref:Uncharacterized protein n=1 Tax=Entamoeba invadens IP1 TaxID=370355 RepID=A0A0A1U7K6_ENTIV|nr:hypothetical protein EIN_164360 [Entamoeba invadens IP1]ELP89036.1 hypothetical protein EIN_164360 [Entamoeba invadens IP1]|eukprot:XP_004255807.1 hypothetical protein EIN_164360 [Entamoeba invadens IP1]